MSKLEELIARLCPDGVEYKTVGEIANISRGKVMSKDYLRDNIGDYPVYSSQTENDGKLGSISTYMVDGDYLTWTTDGANAGTVFFRSGKFSITNVCGLIDVTDKNVLIRYLYYVLFKEAPNHVNAGMGNPKLMSNVMSKIKLPVPPLEVQREIVHILDSYTAFNNELKEQLEKELAARQKQYEFYRDALLTFKNIDDTILNERTNELELSGVVRWMKFGDSCELKAGKAIPALEISSECNEEYNYPCYGGNGLRGYVREYNNVGCHPLVGRQGALCGNVCYAADSFYATEHAIVVTPKDVYNPRFLYYLLKVAKLEQYKTAGAQPGLSVARLEKIELPVPPLSEQQRIVDILDRFDALCNDITSGLPAEIEARQKQYEYYRDKLLTFKELKKEA